MSVFISVLLLLKVLSVMSDEQCDCSTLTYLKHLLQREMFERKFEDTMLRSELQKSGSAEGADIITLVEKLERIIDVLHRITQKQEGVENYGQSKTSKSSVNEDENLLFQTIVKQGLKTEKLERMNFISHVKSQMDNLSDIVSDFKTTTGNFVNEQALEWSANNKQFEKNITQQFSEFRESFNESIQDHVMQTKTDMDKMRDDIIQFDKNTSNKLEMLSVNVKTQMDHLSEIVSDFKTTTGNFVNEQALEWSANNKQFEKNITQQFSEFRESFKESIQDHVMQTKTDMDKMRNDIIQFDKHTSNKLEMFRETVKNDREADKVYINTFLNGIIDNLTDVRESINECNSSIGLNKSDMNNIKNNVESGLRVVEELNDTFGEHLNSSERQFSLNAQKVGICRGVNGNESEWEENWKWHGNKCYRFSKDRKTWLSALAWCGELNATLVEIESKEENDYVTANMKEIKETEFWVGLNDQEKEAAWKWNSANSTLKAHNFRNWAPKEPNNNNIEDCGAVYTISTLQGQWNDLPCSRLQEFVCQKNPELSFATDQDTAK